MFFNFRLIGIIIMKLFLERIEFIIYFDQFIFLVHKNLNEWTVHCIISGVIYLQNIECIQRKVAVQCTSSYYMYLIRLEMNVHRMSS